MFIKKLGRCKQFIAGDNSLLKELLNPNKENIDVRYSLAHARVKPGETTRLHKLKVSEVYYIINGKGEMRIADKTEGVSEGDTVYIPPDAIQSIKNTGSDELIFLCIVDPAWTPEIEEIL